MSRKKNRQSSLISYKRFVPEQLHKELERCIRYLETLPYSRMTCCTRCGSTRITRKGMADNGIMHYYCFACKRHFSPVTDLPIINSERHDLWPELLELMFYGSEKQQSAKILGICAISVSIKEKILEQVMAEDFSNIYQYWMQYKFALEDYIPPKVESQIRLTRNWLTETFEPSRSVCPNCFGTHCTQNQAVQKTTARRCRDCGLRFSVLRGTPFVKSYYTLADFLAYFDTLLTGASNYDVREQLGMADTTAQRWRKVFYRQLKTFHYYDLYEWIVRRRIGHELYVNYVKRGLLD